jgi:thiosulfate dehydrogenase [quinone] large subunit
MSTVDHVQDEPARTTGLSPTHLQRLSPADASADADVPATPVTPWLAALRIAVGFIFLWSFLDKLLGLGYAVPSDRAWVNGGSPTEGFLSSISVGPLEGTFHDWAGQAWVDWLFMAGMAGVGIAAILGVGLRIAAVSGTLMMMFLWASQWPPAQHTSAGEPSGSNNPVIDTHVVYALVLIVVAVARAGDHWGLGRLWARLPLVQRFPVLR